MCLFPQLLTFMQGAARSSSDAHKKNIVVHCVHGQSRSAATIVAYLTSLPGSIDAPPLTLPEALTLLKSKCPRICINPGFLSQLHLWCNRDRFPAEYNMVLNHKAEQTVFGNVPSITDIYAGQRKASYYLRCRGCRNILFRAHRTKPVVVDDANDVCTVARALVECPHDTVLPSNMRSCEDCASGNTDIRDHLVHPRPESAALIDEYLDEYYHGYHSPMEYDRQTQRIACPFDLEYSTGGAAGGSVDSGKWKSDGGKEKGKGGGGKRTKTSSATQKQKALVFYAHPEGWLHQQRRNFIGGGRGVSGNEWDVCCPGCTAPLGIYRKGGLLLCDGLLKIYLAALCADKLQWEFI